MNILILGDVMGPSGRKEIKKKFKKDYRLQDDGLHDCKWRECWR